MCRLDGIYLNIPYLYTSKSLGCGWVMCFAAVMLHASSVKLLSPLCTSMTRHLSHLQQGLYQMSELRNSLTCTLHFSTVDIIEGMKKMRRVKCELSREVQKWEKIFKVLRWSETCVFMDFWSSWSVLSSKFSKSAPSRFLWHLEDAKSTPLPFLYSSVSHTTCHHISFSV